jgi:tRNA1(Val) A37 N6-methylase TrmN6
MTVAVAETTASRKERGGIYTPPAIARFLSDWAIRSRAGRVLEPSCGDGVFVAAALERLTDLQTKKPAEQIVAVERDTAEFEKARSAFADVDIRNASFFDVDPQDVPRVDAVVGNPPYIRYHGFTGSERTRALERARVQGVSLSNLASSWAHFVVHAGSFLATDGRLALVLPAEILHTDYAAPVREWLLKRFASVCIITFDSVAFADAQVDALLVLASQDSDAGLQILRVADAKDLSALDVRSSASSTACTGGTHPAACGAEGLDTTAIAARSPTDREPSSRMEHQPSSRCCRSRKGSRRSCSEREPAERADSPVGGAGRSRLRGRRSQVGDTRGGTPPNTKCRKCRRARRLDQGFPSP